MGISKYVSLLLLVTMTTGHEILWCHTVHPEDNFHTMFDLLGVTGDVIPTDVMDDLITHTFQRMSCDQRNLGTGTCDKCCQADYIYKILQIPPAGGFNEENFHKASLILLEFARTMETICERGDSHPWDSLSYENFTRAVLDFHNHGNDDDHFDDHQLEEYIEELDKNYRPGVEIKVDDDGNIIEPDPKECIQQTARFFRSHDLYDTLDPEDHDLGIPEVELGLMSSSLLVRFYMGDCVQEDGHAHPGDFAQALFHKLGFLGNCTIDRHEFEHFLEDIGIGDGGHDHAPHNAADDDDIDHHSNTDNGLTNENHDVDHHDDHDHDHDHGHGVDVSEECYPASEMLDIFSIEDYIDRDDVINISPALLQQISDGCHGDVQDPGHSDDPTIGEAFGYGTLSVAIISLCAAFGIIIVRWRHTTAYKYILSTMLGLGVGALVGDSLLHLIPMALGVHGHDDGDDHSHDHGIVLEDFVAKMILTCCSIWAFFMLQLGVEFIGISKTKKVHIHNSHQYKGDIEGKDNPVYTMNVSSLDVSNDIKDNNHCHEDKQLPHSNNHQHSHYGDHQAPEAVAYMILIGDGLHNFADGLAIGAAFTVSWQTGVATSIAVLLHELPHEFGDIAALLSVGWSWKKVLGFNMLSAMTAFLGLFIGVPIANSLDATPWILSVAAGMFLYVAMSDLIPELLEHFRIHPPFLIFLAANGGIALGFLCMILIAVFEEHITFD